MFIPLGRFYEFCRSMIDDDVVIYGFDPPGSKNISDCVMLAPNPRTHNDHTLFHLIFMIVHEQEPLNFRYYQNLSLENLKKNRIASKAIPYMINPSKSDDIWNIRLKKNLAFLFYGVSRCDVTLITHSEKNSPELEKYEKNNFVGIYWWAHVPIAQDWYRFAKVDRSLDFSSGDFKYDFNVYNRAWSGTREYRLKFTDLVIEKNLVPHANIRFNPEDNGVYYQDHRFINEQMCPMHDLEILPANQFSSCSSADYSSNDYRECAIDIVLETLFDDPRWHLTEKTLRPIACGKPFILAGTCGILSYLKSYGFKTFGDYIDESYDSISDPVERLDAITESMKNIASLSKESKINLYKHLDQIAQYNKKLFWSEEFTKKIWNEFQDNYRAAYKIAHDNMGGRSYRDMRIELVKTDPEWFSWLAGKQGRLDSKIMKERLLIINRYNQEKINRI